MNARDELLAALTAERYSNTWWTSASKREEAVVMDDSETTVARRRRDLAEDFERSYVREAR
jgi:hypothetical protein